MGLSITLGDNALPLFGSGGGPHPPEAGWQTPISTSQDDHYVAIALPFTIYWNNIAYTTLYVCSNSYVNTGAAATTYTCGAGSPPYPKIFLGGADNSYQRLSYLNTEPNNHYVHIRYEGNGATTGVVGSPGIVWEMKIFNPEFANGTQWIEVRIGTHNRLSGAFGQASNTTYYWNGSITANTSYVLEGNANGTAWTKYDATSAIATYVPDIDIIADPFEAVLSNTPTLRINTPSWEEVTLGDWRRFKKQKPWPLELVSRDELINDGYAMKTRAEGPVWNVEKSGKKGAGVKLDSGYWFKDIIAENPLYDYIVVLFTGTDDYVGFIDYQTGETLEYYAVTNPSMGYGTAIPTDSGVYQNVLYIPYTVSTVSHPDYQKCEVLKFDLGTMTVIGKIVLEPNPYSQTVNAYRCYFHNNILYIAGGWDGEPGWGVGHRGRIWRVNLDNDEVEVSYGRDTLNVGICNAMFQLGEILYTTWSAGKVITYDAQTLTEISGLVNIPCTPYGVNSAAIWAPEQGLAWAFDFYAMFEFSLNPNPGVITKVRTLPKESGYPNITRTHNGYAYYSHSKYQKVMRIPLNNMRAAPVEEYMLAEQQVYARIYTQLQIDTLGNKLWVADNHTWYEDTTRTIIRGNVDDMTIDLFIGIPNPWVVGNINSVLFGYKSVP